MHRQNGQPDPVAGLNDPDAGGGRQTPHCIGDLKRTGRQPVVGYRSMVSPARIMFAVPLL